MAQHNLLFSLLHCGFCPSFFVLQRRLTVKAIGEVDGKYTV